MLKGRCKTKDKRIKSGNNTFDILILFIVKTEAEKPLSLEKLRTIGRD
jgi:hypothetical protein